MNLIITDYCNRSCPYCFAREKVDLAGERSGAEPKHMSLVDFERCLRFLERSQNLNLKLLGGEPSIHPQLPEMVSIAIAQGFNLTIFTNGLWPEPVRAFFMEFQDAKVQFVLNVNEPDRQADWENAQQRRTMEIAGQRIILGFNIYHEDFDLLFMADLIDTYSLKRSIRLGLAQPIVRKQNAHLSNSQLAQAGKRLVRQLVALEQRDIVGGIDCGFPLCMFDEADLGKLIRSVSPGFNSVCQSVIDVGPDLKVWPCFPLSDVLNVHLRDFQTRQEINEYYLKRMTPLRSFGSTDACVGCKFLRRNQCCGGCLARTIRSWEASGDTQLLEKMELFR